MARAEEHSTRAVRNLVFNTHDFSSGNSGQSKRLNDRLMHLAASRCTSAAVGASSFPFGVDCPISVHFRRQEGRPRSVAGCPTRADARGLHRAEAAAREVISGGGMREGQRALACFGPHRSSDEEYFPRPSSDRRKEGWLRPSQDRSI